MLDHSGTVFINSPQSGTSTSSPLSSPLLTYKGQFLHQHHGGDVIFLNLQLFLDATSGDELNFDAQWTYRSLQIASNSFIEMEESVCSLIQTLPATGTKSLHSTSNRPVITIENKEHH